MAWRTLQTILVPAVLIGGYFLASEAGGFAQSAWDDFAGPFLIMYWVGLGFTYTWDIVRESVKGARPGVVAATAGAVLLVLVVMVGPVELIDDPWLFGVVIAPGIELALPYLRGRRDPPEVQGEE
jgi:hypothetical protein